jgi:hypothetical protein
LRIVNRSIAASHAKSLRRQLLRNAAIPCQKENGPQGTSWGPFTLEIWTHRKYGASDASLAYGSCASAGNSELGWAQSNLGWCDTRATPCCVHIRSYSTNGRGRRGHAKSGLLNVLQFPVAAVYGRRRGLIDAGPRTNGPGSFTLSISILYWIDRNRLMVWNPSAETQFARHFTNAKAMPFYYFDLVIDGKP